MQTKNIFYKQNIYIDFLGRFPTIADEVERCFLEQYLSTVAHYPYIGDSLKDGREVVEGLDYKIGYQENVRKRGEHWMHVWKSYYNKISDHNKKRMVAIGIPTATVYKNNFDVHCINCEYHDNPHGTKVCKRCGYDLTQNESLSKKTEEKEAAGKDIIDFGMFLTGHSRKSIEQLYDVFTRK